MWLAGKAQAEDEEPSQRCHDAGGSEGHHRLAVVGENDRGGFLHAAVEDRHRRQQNQGAGDHHDRALHYVGVNRGDDSSGYTVEDQYGGGDYDAGDQPDVGEHLDAG